VCNRQAEAGDIEFGAESVFVKISSGVPGERQFTAGKAADIGFVVREFGTGLMVPAVAE
jgi:hypothetical protein